jgi:hypothetical protein
MSAPMIAGLFLFCDKSNVWCWKLTIRFPVFGIYLTEAGFAHDANLLL